MSNTICKLKINTYRDKKDLLNSRSSKGHEHENTCQKRDFKIVFNSLSEFEQRQLLKNLKIEYSLILFDYFSSEDSIDNKIKNFAREAFNISLPMNKIVEIHLDLIDTLKSQLMLEGLHVEYLSDFRLTLIDVIANLGELYRNARCPKC